MSVEGRRRTETGVLWMKAALQFPGLNQFIEEVRNAMKCQGLVSRESVHKAVELAESANEYQIRSLF